eukprot:scaffold27928_cov115-Isochrysis_galbana.AAC.5
MSISSYSSYHSAASQPLSQDFIRSTPSRQSGMVQPVIQEMYDVRDRARRRFRFVSPRFIQFMFNPRFDSGAHMCQACEQRQWPVGPTVTVTVRVGELGSGSVGVAAGA